MSNDESQPMSRRSFVATSLAAGALIGSGSMPQLALPGQSDTARRREHADGGQVEEKTVGQLQDAMQKDR